MDDGVITTGTSQEEGRLKVGAGSMRSKKMKIARAAVKDFKKKKKDGVGGPGDLSAPSYGAPNTTGMLPSQSSTNSPPGNILPSSPASPTLALSNKNTGFKLAKTLKLKGFPKQKKLGSISSSIKGLKKKMKF